MAPVTAKKDRPHKSPGTRVLLGCFLLFMYIFALVAITGAHSAAVFNYPSDGAPDWMRENENYRLGETLSGKVTFKDRKAAYEQFTADYPEVLAAIQKSWNLPEWRYETFDEYALCAHPSAAWYAGSWEAKKQEVPMRDFANIWMYGWVP